MDAERYMFLHAPLEVSTMNEPTIETIEHHAHRWQLDEQARAQGVGRCTICGANRLFRQTPD
jgi:hypothetical protein